MVSLEEIYRDIQFLYVSVELERYDLRPELSETVEGAFGVPVEVRDEAVLSGRDERDQHRLEYVLLVFVGAAAELGHIVALNHQRVETSLIKPADRLADSRQVLKSLGIVVLFGVIHREIIGDLLVLGPVDELSHPHIGLDGLGILLQIADAEYAAPGMAHEIYPVLAEPVSQIIDYIVHVFDLLGDGHRLVFSAFAVVLSRHALIPADHDAVIRQISALLRHDPAPVADTGTAVHEQQDLRIRSVRADVDVLSVAVHGDVPHFV